MRWLMGAVLAVVVLSAAGCATHVPMSQTVMFHDEGDTDPVHPEGHGVGFVGTGQITSTAFLEEAARERYSEPEAEYTEVEPDNTRNQSFGIYGAVYNHGTFGFSGTVGINTVGIDFTTKIAGRNYLTASGSLYGGAQVSLQHRAFNSSLLGVSAGVGYRYGHRLLEVNNVDPDDIDRPSGFPFFERSLVPVHSAGARGVVVLRPGRTFSGGLMGTLYVGYAPEFQRPVITFGVTMGIF